MQPDNPCPCKLSAPCICFYHVIRRIEQEQSMRKQDLHPYPVLVAVLLACAVAACSKQDKSANESVAGATPAVAEPAESATKPTDATSASKFDRNQVAVSDASMGEFPYVTLPQNYSSDGR